MAEQQSWISRAAQRVAKWNNSTPWYVGDKATSATRRWVNGEDNNTKPPQQANSGWTEVP